MDAQDVADELEQITLNLGVGIVLSEEVYQDDAFIEPEMATRFNEALINFHDALDRLMKLVVPRKVSQTVFPTVGAATDYLDGLRKSDGLIYRICQDGAGRCVIKRFKLDRVI